VYFCNEQDISLYRIKMASYKEMNMDSGKSNSCIAVLGLAITMLVVMVLFSLTLSSVQYYSSVSALRLIGERFFANGTGMAYFDDGTTASFRHTITSAAGYYYDNSTVFAVGEIPGFEMNDTITTLGIPGDVITVTIPYGAEVLGNRSLQPSSIIKGQVGDVVTFKNEDWRSHSIRSPPDTYGGEAVPEGANFEFSLASGQSASILLSKPIGMHYELVGEGITGAVIVEERDDRQY
jgi:hypothetical protein